MSTLGQQLRELRERSGWSQQMVADLAKISLQTVAAVERDDANWSSAVAVATALGRRLLIHAPRSRKQTAAMVAEATGMSVNTVIRVMAICAEPSRLDTDVHLANLAKYLSVIGGSVIVRK